jgi:hypothetical protein
MHDPGAKSEVSSAVPPLPLAVGAAVVPVGRDVVLGDELP